MPIIAIAILVAFAFIVVQIRTTEATTVSAFVRHPDIVVRTSDNIGVRFVVAPRVLVELRKKPSSPSSSRRSMRTAQMSSCTRDSQREMDRTLDWWLEDPDDERAERAHVGDVLPTTRTLIQLQSRMREPTTAVAPRTKSA